MVNNQTWLTSISMNGLTMQAVFIRKSLSASVLSTSSSGYCSNSSSCLAGGPIVRSQSSQLTERRLVPYLNTVLPMQFKTEALDDTERPSTSVRLYSCGLIGWLKIGFLPWVQNTYLCFSKKYFLESNEAHEMLSLGIGHTAPTI